MTEINLCSPTQEAQEEEINLCSSKQEAQNEEISLCPGEEVIDCTDVTELFISGTDEPEVNDTYTASGGMAPYSYSFTGGGIDSTGKITSVDTCGGPINDGAVAHVSVSDACGQAAQIEVRLPGGTWYGVSQDDDSMYCSSGVQCAAVTCYSGRLRYIETWRHRWTGAPNAALTPNCGTPYSESLEVNCNCLYTRQIHEWRCPP